MSVSRTALAGHQVQGVVAGHRWCKECVAKYTVHCTTVCTLYFVLVITAVEMTPTQA